MAKKLNGTLGILIILLVSLTLASIAMASEASARTYINNVYSVSVEKNTPTEAYCVFKIYTHATPTYKMNIYYDGKFIKTRTTTGTFTVKSKLKDSVTHTVEIVGPGIDNKVSAKARAISFYKMGSTQLKPNWIKG